MPTKTIWKFPLRVADTQQVSVPRGAQILSAQVQHGALCLWALVEPDEPREDRTIVIVGTGNQAPIMTRLRHIGTAQMAGGSLVWHVFEVA